MFDFEARFIDVRLRVIHSQWRPVSRVAPCGAWGVVQSVVITRATTAFQQTENPLTHRVLALTKLDP